MFVFPHASVACHVRVAANVLVAVMLVTVLSTWTVTALQVSVATGVSKVHAVPADTLRSGWHTNVGGVVSRTVMVWTQLRLLPHWSAAVQVRKIILVPAQWLLTTSL